jgi:hypothetical protein
MWVKRNKQVFKVGIKKVYNMKSNNSGRQIPNQFLIVDANHNHYFQSYDTIIACRTNEGKIYLDENRWDYSKTTGKYRNMFLNENKAKTKYNIDRGNYILTDLNC